MHRIRYISFKFKFYLATTLILHRQRISKLMQITFNNPAKFPESIPICNATRRNVSISVIMKTMIDNYFELYKYIKQTVNFAIRCITGATYVIKHWCTKQQNVWNIQKIKKSKLVESKTKSYGRRYISFLSICLAVLSPVSSSKIPKKCT